MNKRFFVSVVVTFVLLIAIGFLVHGVLLANDYAHVPALFRSEEGQMNHLPFMLIAHLIAAFALVWIYVRIKGDGPFLTQGVLFGFAIASVMIIPKFLIYFAIQPMPGVVALKQIIFDTIGLVLIAIVVARLNR